MLSYVTDDFVGGHLQHVEMDGFCERSAFSDEDDISFFDCESWGAMGWDVSMSLFISIVFGDIVEIISSHNDCSLHFGGDDDTLQDLASNGDVAGEGTFFIDVVALDGFLWGFEVQSDILVIPDS